MSGIAQAYPSGSTSAWLRNPRFGWQTQMMYSRIVRGSTQPPAGARVWTQWWIGQSAGIGNSQAQVDRTAFLGWTYNGNVRAHETALLPPISRGNSISSLGPIVWNKWFFDSTFTPIQRLGANLSTGVFAYTGQDAFLSFPHIYFLLLDATSYDFELGVGTADRGISADIGTFAYTGEDINFSIGHTIPIIIDAGIFSYTGFDANFNILSPGRAGLLLTTSTRVVNGPKRVSETLSPPFDFSVFTIAGDVLSNPQVTITVYSGVDPNPQAMFGGYLVNGTVVYVTLRGGVAGAIYRVKVTVTASLTGTPELDSLIAVLPDGL